VYPVPQDTQELEGILTKDVLGRTMMMVNNCYSNMDDAEFRQFLMDYSKAQHKYEPDINRCDGCNGVADAAHEIQALIHQATVGARKEELEHIVMQENVHWAEVDAPVEWCIPRNLVIDRLAELNQEDKTK
jgi:hypothetical protein